jgi:tetratricopeptide (TPR) repeat protein
LSSTKVEGLILSSENFRDTLKGTWLKRYQRVIKRYPEAKFIYDSIEIIRKIGIRQKPSTIVKLAQLIASENIIKRTLHRWHYFFILKKLIETENILNPKDGQIEAKGYQLDLEDYLANSYFDIGREYYARNGTFYQFVYFYGAGVVFLVPKGLFLKRDPSLLDKILGIAVQAGGLLNNIANAYRFYGFYEHASVLYKRSLELKKWDITALLIRKYRISSWMGLGRSYYDLDLYDQAIDAFLKAAELHKKSASPWYWLGNVYYALKDYDNAIESFQKSIKLDPQFAPPWNGLSYTLRAINRYDAAIQACQKSIELNSKSAYYWHNLGITYQILKQYDAAIEAYNKAIELDPKDSSSWYGLGTVFLILRNSERALSAYQKAVELSPNSGMFRASLVGSLRKLGKEPEALEQEKVAHSLIDKEDEYTRACYASICGNTEEALRLLKVALEQKEVQLDWVHQDPDFDFMRDDPRFKRLVGLQ